MLEPKIRVPQKPLKLNFQQRQDAAVQRDLKSINDLLDTAKFTKGGRGLGECWPAPLSEILEKGRLSTTTTKKRLSSRPAGQCQRLAVRECSRHLNQFKNMVFILPLSLHKGSSLSDSLNILPPSSQNGLGHQSWTPRLHPTLTEPLQPL